MLIFSFFFFNDTATTEIYTLSLHDALPILLRGSLQLQLFEVRLGIPGLKGHRLEDGLERAGVLAVLGAVTEQEVREEPLAQQATLLAQHFVEGRSTLGREVQ